MKNYKKFKFRRNDIEIQFIGTMSHSFIYILLRAAFTLQCLK